MPTMLQEKEELSPSQKRDVIRKIIVSKTMIKGGGENTAMITKIKELLLAFHAKSVTSIDDSELDSFYTQLNTL